MGKPDHNMDQNLPARPVIRQLDEAAINRIAAGRSGGAQLRLRRKGAGRKRN